MLERIDPRPASSGVETPGHATGVETPARRPGCGFTAADIALSSTSLQAITRMRSALRHLSPRLLLRLATVAVVFSLTPAPAAGQYGFIGSLANRFSDLSFFANVGGLLPDHDHVRSDRLRSFGLEILFEIGSVARQIGPVPESTDSVRIVWREMRVERTAEGVDTVNIYDVEAVTPRAPMVDVWTFEVGLGYGQTSGFDAREPTLDMRGALRDLPALSLYASYEGSGTYFGIRSGLMELTSLQVIDEAGAAFKGSGKSFMAGLLIGQAWSVAGLNFFVEGAYMVRDFPSVEWASSTPPPGTPRSMNLSGWSLGGGVQFSVGG